FVLFDFVQCWGFLGIGADVGELVVGKDLLHAQFAASFFIPAIAELELGRKRGAESLGVCHGLGLLNLCRFFRLKLGLVDFGLSLGGLLFVALEQIGRNKARELGEGITDGVVARLDKDFGIERHVGLLGDFVQHKGVAHAMVGDDVE